MNKSTPSPKRRLIRKKPAQTPAGKPFIVKRKGKASISALPPRDVAVKFYAAWMKRPQRIEPLLEDFHKKNEWTHKDRALFNDLAYGLIRQHGRLSWQLSKFSNRKAPTNRFALAATSIGLYHIQFHDRVPDHAAVDTSVELTKYHAGPQLASWCNAVLRSAIELRDKLGNLDPRFPENNRRLAAHYSHPEWLVERWSRRMSERDLERLLAWNNRRPDIVFRINQQRGTTEEALEYLKTRNIDAIASKLDPTFLHMPKVGEPGRIALLRDGRAVVQDPAQGLAARLLDPQPDEEILDLCAAPGGKTFHLADLCPDCHIFATDKSEERLEKLQSGIRQQRLDNVKCVDYQSMLSATRKYDAILVDAPCSGTGVLARRVDLRWRLEATDIHRMANLQKQLLSYASERLKKGGRIVYSTCTLEPEENEMLLDEFLAQNPQFTLSKLPGDLDTFRSDDTDYLKITGPQWFSDGAFIARLELNRSDKLQDIE